MFEDLQFNRIRGAYARTVVEELVASHRALEAENRRLRDELQRVKGEQGPPRIPGNTPKPAPRDYSSEAERRELKPRTKRAKNATLPIDREERLPLDLEPLPADAEFKGYAAVVVQDVVLRRETIRFQRAKWYAPSTGKTYLAPVPRGYEGAFGPGIKALTVAWYFAGEMSEPKIREVWASIGVEVSAGQISQFLIHRPEPFAAEAHAVFRAGLASGPFQHLDDTATRVNGQNQYCQVVCNALYTVYRTTETKDRQAVLDVLRGGAPRTYRLTAVADAWLATTGVARWVREAVAQWPRDVEWTAAELAARLAVELPRLGPQQQRWVADALAIGAYRAQTVWPVVDLLVVDDAGQWQGVTAHRALCWIHDGRLYKRLEPVVPAHRRVLGRFLKRYWAYYHQLRAYQQAPTATARRRLAARFDTLFATRTGYVALDDRIVKTRAKRTELLQVLEHPEVPLHNNPAELGARRRVRKRDVSFGPRTAAGKAAWDTFMTLVATTQKLGVSFYAYVRDRLTAGSQVPPLDQLIAERAATLQLGQSWTAE